MTLTRRQQARIWLVDHLPAGLLFHPAEALLALICIISGVRLATTGADSASLQATLPPFLIAAWGVMLIVGAIALSSGLFSIRRAGVDRYVVTRVPAYRLGLRLLGISAFIYSASILGYAGSAGLLAALFPLAFSGMCGLRLLSLGGR